MGAMRNRSQRLCDAVFATALMPNTPANSQIATCTIVDFPITPKRASRVRTTYEAATKSNAELALALALANRNFVESTAFAPPKATSPNGRPATRSI